MAEIMLKIGDEAGFLDGDPIHAFNDRKILWTNANVICHHRRAGFNRDGLRPAASAAEEYAKLTSEYKFERVSEREVLRTRIATNEQDVFSDVPKLVDGRLQHIFVQDYVDYATKRDTHRIFGAPGAEVWYGGSIRIDTGKVPGIGVAVGITILNIKDENKIITVLDRCTHGYFSFQLRLDYYGLSAFLVHRSRVW